MHHSSFSTDTFSPVVLLTAIHAPLSFGISYQSMRLPSFMSPQKALRLLKRAGNASEMIERDTTSLGAVGEPIAPEIWEWYHKHVGKEKAPIPNVSCSLTK